MDKWPQGRGYGLKTYPKTMVGRFTWAGRCRGSVDWAGGPRLLGEPDVALQHGRRLLALLLWRDPCHGRRFCLVYHTLARWPLSPLVYQRSAPARSEAGLAPGLGAGARPPHRRPRVGQSPRWRPGR